jgi:hypothetical protein
MSQIYKNPAGGGGPGTPVQTITGNDGIATTPTSNNINIFGLTVANATNAVPVYLKQTSTSTDSIEVQVAEAAASSNINNVGLASFNNVQFSVDANGYVSATGAIPIQFTGNTGTTASPSSGNINIFGSSTSAGSTPVSSTASGSTVTLNIQKSQAIASTNASNVGLAAFNSTEFTVDSNGYVSLISSGGSTPNSTLSLSDDFLTYAIGYITTPSAIILSILPWSTTGTWQDVADSVLTTGNPGLITHGSITTHASLATGSGYIILGGGVINCNWVLKTATLSNSTNRYTLYAGLGVGDTGSAYNGIYFSYNDNVNSGNWVCTCEASGVTTTINTTVAPSTSSFFNLGFTVNASATSVEFFINTVSQGTITTHIPTGTTNADLDPTLSIVQSAGTIAASSVVIDLFYYSQALTTPR